MKRYVIAGLIGSLIIAAVVLDRYTKMPPALAPETLSAQLLEKGFYEVDSYSIAISDESRPQNTNKGQQKEARKLIGTLWYPVIEEGLVAPGKHPLLLFQLHHKNRLSLFAPTAELLASKGYLVSVLKPTSYIGRNNLVNNLAQQTEYARDVSFLLDNLTEWNQSPDTPFYSRIDFDRIAVGGYSTGSITALLASFHPTLHDARIDLGIYIAPIASLFTEKLYQQRTELPVLTIASNTDMVAPYTENALKITESHQQSTLINIKHGSHAGFSSKSRYLRWFNNPDFINCHRLAAAIKHSNQSEILAELTALAPDVIATEPGQQCAEREQAAINTLQQNQLGVLAMQAFLESHFADTKFERNIARNYLQETMAIENENVSVFLPNTTTVIEE